MSRNTNNPPPVIFKVINKYVTWPCPYILPLNLEQGCPYPCPCP